MELYARHLACHKLVLYAYVINMVVFYAAERTSHVTDDTRLTAVVDLVVSYYVRADLLAAPACAQTVHNRLELTAMSRLSAEAATVIVARRCFLTEAHRTAL